MDSILRINNLSIQVDQRVLMQGVSFCVNPGEVVLLSGENGVGKSTLLKSILGLDMQGKSISGEIVVCGFGNVLDLDREELQRLRASVAYVQQKDDYSEMGGVQVRDIFSDSGNAFSGKELGCSEVDALIDKWIPRREGEKKVFAAKSKPSRFSGGEQRLLSVLSVIATRPNAELLIIDEPLNNLDFVNARNISNLINRVIKDNPNMAVIMVSHCRIFPFVTREIRLTANGIQELSNHYVCHSCFGEPDDEGFY